MIKREVQIVFAVIGDGSSTEINLNLLTDCYSVKPQTNWPKLPTSVSVDPSQPYTAALCGPMLSIKFLAPLGAGIKQIIHCALQFDFRSEK